MTLSPPDFKYLTDLIKSRSGISLGTDKEYLVETRLSPVVRKHQLANLQGLVAKLRSSLPADLVTDVVEALTTNETLFFRDTKPFEQLKATVLPHITAHSTDGVIRIWSAACSTGQEAYSTAMTIRENQAMLTRFRVEILGTDIDRNVVEKASRAIYTQFEVQRGLPVMMLAKYFTQPEPYGDSWVLKSNVSSMANFRVFNLLDDYSPLGKFDIIYCRNVLIYFEPETKASILRRLAGQLKPHGVLYLGSTENAREFTDKLAPFKDLKGVYSLS